MKLIIATAAFIFSAPLVTAVDNNPVTRVFRRRRTKLRGKDSQQRTTSSIIYVPSPSDSSSKSPYSPSSKSPSFPSSKSPSFPSTKSPSFPSSKSPSFPSTKSPSSPSSKSPSFPSTKSPSFPSSKSPSFPSTKSPSFPSSKAPATSPTLPQPQCTIETSLGYPEWDDPVEADYYGFHADYLTVFRGNDKDNYCDAFENPDWCSYVNTAEDGTSAFIGKIDDLYYEEFISGLDEEIFTIYDAEGEFHHLCVAHWFMERDYYPDYYEWNDKMMAATLTVKVNGHDLGGEWSHPVDPSIDTHIEREDGETVINDDYEGIFCITVTCTNTCDCIAHDYTLYDDDDVL